MTLKERTAIWVHEHIDGLLLTLGTSAGTAGLTLISVHEWLGVILQLTGLFSFAMYCLMNYEKWYAKVKGILIKLFR